MFFRSTSLTFEAALRDIQASQPAQRVLAAEVLARAESEDERDQAFRALAEALGDARPEVRSTACFSLAELGRDEVHEAIALCLDDTVPEVRQSAAIALGTLGSAHAAPALRKALREGPADLRFQAATSLAEVDLDGSYEPLLAALREEEDGEVLGAIALSLGATGRAACADALAELLEHARAATRLDAACALATLGDPRAIDALATALVDADGGWDAAVSLEELGTDSLSALREFVASPRGLLRVRLRAASAVLALAHQRGDDDSDTASKRALVEALRSRKFEIRALAIHELARVGQDWAKPALEALARSLRGRRQREEIREALTAIAESRTLPRQPASADPPEDAP